MITNIPPFKKLKSFDFSGCPWIHSPVERINLGNRQYYENIIKLIILQRFFKKIIISKRLLRLIPKLMPLYYNPSAKGGYLHKRNMIKFINNI